MREESRIEIIYKSVKVRIINYAKLTTEMTEFNETVEVTNDENGEIVQLWSYESETGWPDQCKQSNQSPIEIKSEEIKLRTKML